MEYDEVFEGIHSRNFSMGVNSVANKYDNNPQGTSLRGVLQQGVLVIVLS